MFRTGWTAIRDGEYGGPLLLFDPAMSHYVLLSTLSTFMTSNMKRMDEVGQLAFGLMGSVEEVEASSSLETVLVGGTDLRLTLQLWGSTLASYHGRHQVRNIYKPPAWRRCWWEDRNTHSVFNVLRCTTLSPPLLPPHVDKVLYIGSIFPITVSSKTPLQLIDEFFRCCPGVRG